MDIENTSFSSNESYNPYESYEYLKLIVEDTSIEITCHTYCQEDYEQKIIDSGKEIAEYLNNSIEDKKNSEMYINLIDKLSEYCLKIIGTEWYDSSAYQFHIDFIKAFINNYRKEKPVRINASELPFRNLLCFNTQKLILNQKFENELKFWNRYQFIVNHTELLLHYLQQKKYESILYID